MGLSLGGLTEIATLGLVDDPFGTDAAAEAARRGTTQAMQAEREMFDESMGFQREMWDWQKEQAQPWTEAGLGALGQYQDTMQTGFNFSPETDPVYGARLSELSKSIGASGAARGMQLSGGTLRSLREMTAGELGASYGRQREAYQQKLANLGNLINVGAGASTGLSGIGANFSANVGGQMQQFGQQQGQGYMNLGQINAQAATAPFQNLMSLGSVAGGIMSGAGAMGFSAGGSPGTASVPNLGGGTFTSSNGSFASSWR